MSGLWDDIPYTPMPARERADLEAQAGRAFLSEEQAIRYRNRQLNSWAGPEEETMGKRIVPPGHEEVPAQALLIVPGQCRVCHCTEDEACDLGDGFGCWWVDEEHTLCSNAKCLAEVSLDDMVAEIRSRHTAKARGATA